MKNIMKFKGGYKAVISYDEETCMDYQNYS